jgi:tyrosyl-tRNA synthetase
MNAMVPGLGGGKMSASDPNSKIDLLETPEVVKKKIKAAFCEEGNIEENGVLSFVGAVLLPISQLRKDHIAEAVAAGKPTDDLPKPFVGDGAPAEAVFSIMRNPKWGGEPSHYASFETLQQDFKDLKLHPGDLKTAVVDAINSILKPIREAYESSKEWQEVERKAYPPAVSDKPQKKKKVRSASAYFVHN